MEEGRDKPEAADWFRCLDGVNGSWTGWSTCYSRRGEKV